MGAAFIENITALLIHLNSSLRIFQNNKSKNIFFFLRLFV